MYVSLKFIAGPIKGTLYDLEPGEYIIGRQESCEIQAPDAGVSRQHSRIWSEGKDWYIGVMNTEQAREITLPLAFIGAGKFRAKLWLDGAEPRTLDISERAATSADSLTLKLAPSGGAAVRIAPGK